MRSIGRRLLAMVGAAVLLVLALAAGPAAAVTGAMMVQGGRGSGFVTISSPPTGGSRVLITLISAAVVALFAITALGIERRSRRRLVASEGPAENAGQVCDDVVCEWRPSRPEIEERKAA